MPGTIKKPKLELKKLKWQQQKAFRSLRILWTIKLKSDFQMHRTEKIAKERKHFIIYTCMFDFSL